MSVADQKIINADRIIGASAWQMYWWGYPLRTRVCPAIAKVAGTLLQRKCGAIRIEQLMEEWLKSAEFYGVIGLGLQNKPTRFTIVSRKKRRPKNMMVSEIAHTLLTNKGEWPLEPEDDLMIHHDPELTPKAVEKIGVIPRTRRDLIKRGN